MIRKEFSLNGVPFMLAGYNCHIMLETGGIIDVMTDDENIASRLKADVLLSVQSHLLPYSGKTSLEELPDMAINVEQEVTEELTRTTGTDFIMKFDYFLPDDRSRKIIDDIDTYIFSIGRQAHTSNHELWEIDQRHTRGLGTQQPKCYGYSQ